MRVESSGFRLPEGESGRMTPTGDGRYTFALYSDTYEYFPGRPISLSNGERPAEARRDGGSGASGAGAR